LHKHTTVQEACFVGVVPVITMKGLSNKVSAASTDDNVAEDLDIIIHEVDWDDRSARKRSSGFTQNSEPIHDEIHDDGNWDVLRKIANQGKVRSLPPDRKYHYFISHVRSACAFTHAPYCSC
jgi:hypothetical protein